MCRRRNKEFERTWKTKRKMGAGAVVESDDDDIISFAAINTDTSVCKRAVSEYREEADEPAKKPKIENTRSIPRSNEEFNEKARKAETIV
jgi:hypothetical protein